jgi:hypothetical protein
MLLRPFSDLKNGNGELVCPAITPDNRIFVLKFAATDDLMKRQTQEAWVNLYISSGEW